VRTGPIVVKNTRASRRARVRCWATLAWRSWHVPKLLWTRTANMSGTGAMVESAHAVRGLALQDRPGIRASRHQPLL